MIVSSIQIRVSHQNIINCNALLCCPQKDYNAVILCKASEDVVVTYFLREILVGIEEVNLVSIFKGAGAHILLNNLLIYFVLFHLYIIQWSQ